MKVTRLHAPCPPRPGDRLTTAPATLHDSGPCRAATVAGQWRIRRRAAQCVARLQSSGPAGAKSPAPRTHPRRQAGGRRRRTEGAARRDRRRPLRQRTRREDSPLPRAHLFPERAQAGGRGRPARTLLRHLPAPSDRRPQAARRLAVATRNGSDRGRGADGVDSRSAGERRGRRIRRQCCRGRPVEHRDRQCRVGAASVRPLCAASFDRRAALRQSRQRRGRLLRRRHHREPDDRPVAHSRRLRDRPRDRLFLQGQGGRCPPGRPRARCPLRPRRQPPGRCRSRAVQCPAPRRRIGRPYLGRALRQAARRSVRHAGRGDLPHRPPGRGQSGRGRKPARRARRRLRRFDRPRDARAGGAERGRVGRGGAPGAALLRGSASPRREQRRRSPRARRRACLGGQHVPVGPSRPADAHRRDRRL